VERGRRQRRALGKVKRDAPEYLAGLAKPAAARHAERVAALEADWLVRYTLLDSVANVICPAVKLWNTGHGANMMREAVSLVGGYGITEDCPGFLGYKWMDSQLEATYEGPEAVQRRQLSVTMSNEVFLAQYRTWITEMREIANDREPAHAELLTQQGGRAPRERPPLGLTRGIGTAGLPARHQGRPPLVGVQQLHGFHQAEGPQQHTQEVA